VLVILETIEEKRNKKTNEVKRRLLPIRINFKLKTIYTHQIRKNFSSSPFGFFSQHNGENSLSKYSLEFSVN
jgi:hypothetical protein